MAYSDAAQGRRRCVGVKADGTPCRAWALWDDPWQRCVCHAGRHHRGKQTGRRRSERTRYRPCRCPAYKWPHRPGGGLCCWPDPPKFVLTTPSGTHSWPRMRGADLALARALERAYRRRADRR